MANRSYTPDQKRQVISMLDEGFSYRQVSARTGIPSGTISNWHKKSRPAEPAAPTPDDSTLSYVNVADVNERLNGGGDAVEPPPLRENDQPPRRPTDAPIPAQQALNYKGVENWIAGAYGTLAMGARIAGDEALALAIDTNKEKAAIAWANYVRTDPRAAAFLEKLAVGTPLGEVILVHVSIAGAYFFTRSALRAAARDTAESSGQQSPPDYPPGHPLAGS